MLYKLKGKLKMKNKYYNKNDVKFHNEYYRNSYPAVNVKVYHFPSVQQIIDRIPELKEMKDQSQTEELATQASEFAFNMACDIFWNEDAQEIANDHFPDDVKIYSEGRSNGWLVVHGLKDFSEWNAIDLRRWQGFENAIKAEVKYLTSLEWMIDVIVLQKWYLPYAQEYNFYDGKDGRVHCIAIEKAKLANEYPFIR